MYKKTIRKILLISKMAIRSLMINKMRTFLSTLGIIVAVSSLIIITSIGIGAQKSVLSSINSLGSDVIIIMPGKNTNLFKSAIGTNALRKPLTYEDAKYLKSKMPYIKVAPEINFNTNIKFKNIEIATTTVGTTPDIFSIFNYKLNNGIYLSKKDIIEYRYVCVLGYKVAKELFNKTNPIGHYVNIAGNRFLVIGSLKQKGSLNQLDMDDFVFIPISIMELKTNSNNVQFIFVKPIKHIAINLLGIRIKSYLIARHGIENFSLSSENQYIELEKKVANIFLITLTLIGLISLIVGGIGIMNIMLASVAERTREIGIKKALGAKKSDILLQFLIESILISTFGGIIGILIGVICVILFPKNIINAQVSLLSIVTGLIISSITGVFFGAYPAKKASGMNPIDALRYE